jgi:hypothetical protein
MSKQGQQVLTLAICSNLRINHRPCLSINDFYNALFYMSFEGSIYNNCKRLTFVKMGSKVPSFAHS